MCVYNDDIVNHSRTDFLVDSKFGSRVMLSNGFNIITDTKQDTPELPATGPS